MRAFLLRLIFFSFCVTAALSGSAVTQKEMEQARTITAFWYLRYANNGAGYMEDAKMPTTMAELEKILKETERKNLKEFNAVNVPTDYAGWDKQKLINYWGETFFASPGLSAQGKVAKSRVKSKLGALTIASPAPAEETTAPKPEQPAPAPATTDQAKPAEVPSSAAEAVPPASEIVAEAEKADSAALAIEDAAEEKSQRSKSTSGDTWIYIVALIILVGIVVWLVIFASKTMQESNKSASEKEPASREPEAVIPTGKIANIAKPIDELAELRARDREIKGLREECLRLGEENGRLQSDLNESRREIEALRGRLRAAEAVTSAAVAEAAPLSRAVVAKPASQGEAKPQPKPEVREIFLGRVNPKGLFVRADKRPVAEKSVFVLNTVDGYTGTYRVLQIPEVIERCLDNPDHYLAGGCSAPDILATEDAEQIRTLQAGSAVFENGCWRMVRKTKIVYE